MSDLVRFILAPKRTKERTYIRTGNIGNHIIRRTTQQLCNNTELVDMILAREDRSSEQHFGKDAARAPDIDFFIVSLPCEHDLGCAVVSCRDVAGHLGFLYAG